MPTFIDDFTTGADTIDIPHGPAYSIKYQDGATILGGGRYTSLQIAGDPRHQPAHLDVNPDSPGYLNVSLGAEQYDRVEIGYGYRTDGRGGGVQAPLTASGHGNFLSMGRAIRTNFHSADSVYGFNFVVYAALATGPAYAATNFVGGLSPFSIDFSFDGTGPVENQFKSAVTPDFTRVGFVIFIFQVWGDFVIDSFQLV
jgi:hypothetical protein